MIASAIAGKPAILYIGTSFAILFPRTVRSKMPANDRSLEQSTQQLLDEAEALIWGLLDENIDALDTQRLEVLMANAEVRKRYLQCVELHTDLQALFDEKRNTPSDNSKPQSPVLGSLGNMFPGIPGTNVSPPLGD
jgi:hypothetical protein